MAQDVPGQRLLQLEARRAQLISEIAQIDVELRMLRLGDPCPRCGGTGTRPIKSGMYGEQQVQACGCQ